MALWTPSEIDTQLWLDAQDSSTIILDTENRCQDWLDKSGNEHHAFGNAGSRPIVDTDSWVGNLPTVQFDGDQSMSFAPWTSVDTSIEHTYIAVVKLLSKPNFTFILAQGYSGSERESALFYADGDFGAKDEFAFGPWEGSNSSNPLSYIAYGDIDECILIGQGRSGSPNLIYKDGVAGSDFGNIFLKNDDNVELVLGRRADDDLDSGNLVGLVAEVIILDRVDDTERHKLEGYLAHKWNINDKLPVDHPYKSSPPDDGTTRRRMNHLMWGL